MTTTDDQARWEDDGGAVYGSEVREYRAVQSYLAQLPREPKVTGMSGTAHIARRAEMSCQLHELRRLGEMRNA